MKATALSAAVTAAGLAAAAVPYVPSSSSNWQSYDSQTLTSSSLPAFGQGYTSTTLPAVQPQYTSTATSDVAAAAATAKTESPVSHVKGKAFDRFMTIFLEVNGYDDAVSDPNCQALIQQGILQTNMYGTGEPSQPNYVSAASGDLFGDNNDSFLVVAANVSTVVDLLEDRGVSWGDYNEGAPYTGFEGYQYSNPVEGNYVRRHNLLVRFASVTENPDRLAKLKNLTLFYEDLEKERIPQWLFITPNLDHNGHDTNIATSCKWTRDFVEPLLANPYFNNNTLVYITWDANTNHMTARNHVAGIVLGSAVPAGLVGTQDAAYYNHYSQLSTVEANWNLRTLGRWDVGANVFALVGRLTGDFIRTWNTTIAGDSFQNYYWNQSYGGVFSSAANTSHVYPAPNLGLVRNGRHVLGKVAALWGAGSWFNGQSRGAGAGGGVAPTYYRDIIELPDALHPPAREYAVPIGLTPPAPITTPITVYPVQPTATGTA